ncbi:hypothetical protein [Caldimonas brevitalea]|uniref:Transmembrane protein n=1 Tax=Caldimonas brevitalea TaxID=413882 RepID=A0A0G3BSW6_9BURK|nr:hypothetical protein [Caldimonas brevitalea]AKJ30466.1 hypothetical protein AAW51_3775 [Caldimonas brevitalea]
METRVRYLLAAAGGLAYAVVSHQLMTRAPNQPLVPLALLGPFLIWWIISLWRNGKIASACAVGAFAAGLAALVGWGNAVSPQTLYLGQHAGIHLGLGLLFGSSLRPGQQPFITRIAERVHRTFPPVMRVYTRQVTVAWTVYFVVMASLSLLLYCYAPFSAWSVFANLLTPLSLAAMFAGEHVLRYRLHPDFERVGITEAIRAYTTYQDDGRT